MHPEFSVRLYGTRPGVKGGGISSVLPGYLDSLGQLELELEMVEIHHGDSISGKVKPALVELGRMRPLLKDARRRGLVPVVYCHAGRGVSLVRHAALMRAARGAGAVTMLQIHSITTASYLESPVKGWGTRKILGLADQICVLGDYWSQFFRERGLSRVSVVTNPNTRLIAETASASFIEPARINDVLVMTRMVAEKGVALAIDAFERSGLEGHLHVAGDGPDKPNILRRISSSSIRDRITFHGWVSGEKKRALLRDCGVFMLPSRFDSFGLGFVEAMAHGRPVVALDHMGTSDVVLPGKTGILVKDGDGVEARLASALNQMQDRVMWRRLADAGKEHVRKTYASKRVAGQFREALLRAVASQQSMKDDD